MATNFLVVLASANNAELTQLGGADWLHYDATPTLQRKNGGGSLIGVPTLFGTATAFNSAAATRTIAWTDGSPTASGSDAFTRFITPLNTAGAGFEITFPADTTDRVATVYCGVTDTAAATITTILSDASAPNQVITTATAGASALLPLVIQVEYSAASAGQTLTVRVQTATAGGVQTTVSLAAAHVQLQGAPLVVDGGPAWSNLYGKASRRDLQLAQGWWPSSGASGDVTAEALFGAPVAGIESRTFTSAGVGAATWSAQSIESRTLSAAGVGAASFASAAIVPQTFTAAGVGAATWNAAAIVPVTLSSAGVGVSSWSSAAVVPANLSSAGAGAASWASAAFQSATLSSAGVGAASWQASQIEARTFTADGVAAITWDGSDANGGATIESRTLSSAGVASVSFSASAIQSVTLSSAGVGATTFASAAFQTATLQSSGVGAFNPQAAAIEPRTLSSAGVAAATWDGSDANTPTIEERTLSAAGSASAQFVGSDIGEPDIRPSRPKRWPGIGPAWNGNIAEATFAMRGASRAVFVGDKLTVKAARFIAKGKASATFEATRLFVERGLIRTNPAARLVRDNCPTCGRPHEGVTHV